MNTTKLPAAFGERARYLREQAGLSFIDMEVWMRTNREIYGPHVFSYGTLERIEKGAKPEESVDTIFLALLAKLYKCDLEELSPIAAQRSGAVIDLLEYAPRDSNPEPSGIGSKSSLKLAA